MPVHFGVLFAAGRILYPEQQIKQKSKPADDMETVQADQAVVNGAVGSCLQRESPGVQAVEFQDLKQKKQSAQTEAGGMA